MFYRIGFAAVLLVAIVASSLGAQAPGDTSRYAGPLKIVTVVHDSVKKDCDCNKLQAPGQAPVVAPTAATARGPRGYKGKQGDPGKKGDKGDPGTDCTGQVPTVPPRTCFGKDGANGRDGLDGFQNDVVRAVNHHTALWIAGGTILGVLVGTYVYCTTQKGKCGGSNVNNNTNVNNNGMVPLWRLRFP